MADALTIHSCQLVKDSIRAATADLERGGDIWDLVAVMAAEIVRLANIVSNLESEKR